MCFNEANKSDAEKEQIRRERQRAQEEEERKEEEAYERRFRRREEEESKEEEEHERRWNAKKRFKPNIIKAEGKRLVPKSGLKFTIWCSDGYEPDGWHSYQGEPTKEFDSVWNTKEEANNRAEYLFFWKNPWGLDPTEVNDNNEVEPENVDGLKKFSVMPDDSTRWTVGVVPTNAFIHLPNSTNRRHDLDGDIVVQADYNITMGSSGLWN